MKHLVVVVNPRSGTNRRKNVEIALEKVLNPSQFHFDIFETEYAGHGTHLAANASKSGAYAVVAVGGDGSVRDVVKGLIGTRTALCIIPQGSGNGLARALNIPLKQEAAIQLLSEGQMIDMDVGYANEHLFLSNAGVAFDALVSENFEKSQQRGWIAYSSLVMKHFWLYREKEWDLVVDGKRMKETAFLINVANGRQFGYNFKIAPNASWTDGLLDVVIIRKFPKWRAGEIAWRLLRGNILDSRFVEHFHAREVVISHPHLSVLHTDGDAHSVGEKVNFRVVAGAQRVLVP